MRRPCFAVCVVLLVVCTFSLTTLVQAQYRASIQGVVTDPQGAVIPGASITLTDKETNRTLTATSDGSGIYNITALPPSSYTMTVEKTGFKKKTIDNYQVIAEQSNALNVQLELGASTETVNVSGTDIPAIDTQTASLSGTVTADEVQKLPSFGRDVFQLAQLAPGVFGDGARDTNSDTFSISGNRGQGPPGSGGAAGVFQTENAPQISSAGGRESQNNVTLDGIGITSVSWGGAAIVTPNEDSVKEVKVVSNGYDAEDGRFSGAQIKVITKNGTNQYHGSFFFKADRPGLNSFQSYTGSTGFPVAPQRNTNRFNNWGGSATGPIIKDKLFVSFSYERIANKSLSTGTGWYETPDLLKLAPSKSIAAQYAAFPGEAASYTTVNDVPCSSIGLIDPAGAAALGIQPTCNEIPGKGLDIGTVLNPSSFPLGTMDPSQQAPLCVLPPPSAPGTPVPCDSTHTQLVTYRPGLGGDGTGNGSNLKGTAGIALLNTIGPNTQTNQQYHGRVDYYVTSKDSLAFSIYKVPVSNSSFNGDRPANIFFHNAMNEAETALWNHTFSPTLINELRVNAAGWRWNELKDNPQTPLGLPQPGGIGDPNFGNQIGTVCPGCNQLGGVAGSIFDQWTYGLKDVATKVYRSHTIKFGGELTKLRFVQDAPWSARPNFYFKNYWDFLNDAPWLESGTFSPITGIPTDVRKDSRETHFAFFGQDDWKVRPNLTVNLGLRYEYFGPVSFLHNLLSYPVLGSGSAALTGAAMHIGGNLWNADKANFGPQLGFAWSPNRFNSKLVVRGGFGLAYNGEQQAITLNVWPNLPFNNGNANFTGSQVVYAIPSDPHQFEPYPANPNGILSLDPTTHLPAVGSGVVVGVTGVPRNFKTPRTARYSIEAQYDLGRNWVGTFGYQGSNSRHLTRQYNLSQIAAAAGIPLNPTVSDFDWYVHDANAHFNAILMELQHRFAQSFQFDVQYRYARAYDNESGPYKVSYYQWDSKADWGPADMDVRQAFKAYGIYSPTIFHGEHGWMEKIAGGWSFSGILNAHSGLPWTPVYNASCSLTYNNGACYPNNGGNHFLMPAAYKGGAGSSSGNGTFLSQGGNFPNGGSSYFVAPSFTDCSGVAYPGTCPAPQAPARLRNAFRGPRYFDVDATISKGFGLPKMPLMGEGAKIEFRINFYNLFNSLNLCSGGIDRDGGCIDNIVSDPHFGQVVPNWNNGALGGRTIEMQARFSF